MPSGKDDEDYAADLLATLLGCQAEMLDVTLDQLRTLAVVHVTGTAQRAARVLGREQSSVQKQLDTLNKAAARLVGEALWSSSKQVDMVCGSFAAEHDRPPVLEYDFLEWHRERVALLTNLAVRELPDTPVTAAKLPGLPLLAPTAGLLSQFLGRWYGPDYRGVLTVIADIDSLTYGLNLLTAEMLHGCLLTTERVADADARSLRQNWRSNRAAPPRTGSAHPVGGPGKAVDDSVPVVGWFVGALDVHVDVFGLLFG